jgi:DNA-directed RNA polymerase specialized sigma24 family protein
MEIPNQFSTRSDAELLRLAVAEEERAFLLLNGKLKARIFRYAFYMTGSKVNAVEVTQEVFITLLKEAHDYRQNRGDVAGFAFGIACNFVRRQILCDEATNASCTVSIRIMFSSVHREN